MAGAVLITIGIRICRRQDETVTPTSPRERPLARSGVLRIAVQPAGVSWLDAYLFSAGSVTIRSGRGVMRLAEAKDMVLSLILAVQPDAARSLLVSPASPDGDPGKFLIDGKVARVIHRFDGWHVPISLGWFSGGYDQPVIHKTAFYWYAFAIPERGMYLADHYFILRGLFGRPATSRTHRAA